MPNRRKRKPQYLLDVKIHRRGLVQQRLRVGSGLVAATVLLVVSAYGLYRAGHWVADRLVFENERYAIREVLVENEGVLDPHLVAQFAGAQVGQNLLAFDLGQARRNLELIPLVRRAEVRRVLPNQLVIRVEERRPVARLQVSSPALRDAEFLIDRAGTVLKPLRLTDGRVVQPQIRNPLPVLTGVALADIQVGRKVTSRAIYQALDLLDEFHQSAAGSMIDLAQIDLSQPRRLVARTSAGAVLLFQPGEYLQQLRRLGVIVQWAGREQRRIQSVNLTVSQSVPVTFAN